MAPPSATSNGNESQAGTATLEPGLDKSQAAKKEITMPKFPGPKKFADKYEERDYQKGRLALAFRIFAKFGFDEGVAGHITLRVSLLKQCSCSRNTMFPMGDLLLSGSQCCIIESGSGMC